MPATCSNVPIVQRLYSSGSFVGKGSRLLTGEAFGLQDTALIAGQGWNREMSLMIGLERSDNNFPGSFQKRAWRFRLLFLGLGIGWGPLMLFVGRFYYCQAKLFQAALQRDLWLRLILPCELPLIKALFYILSPPILFLAIGFIARISLKCPHCSEPIPIFTTLSLPDKCQSCRKTKTLRKEKGTG